MKLLCIDEGNTCVKATWFETRASGDSTEWLRPLRYETVTMPAAEYLRQNRPGIVLYCSVASHQSEWARALREAGDIRVERLNAETELPIEICYDSRQTLGADRVAVACGALEIAKTRGAETCLVVDAGTAVTMDVVADGRFEGGVIAPGLRLRLESLHQFTAKLPRVNAEGDCPRFGYSTETAIRAGAVHGIVAEVADALAFLRRRYPEAPVIVTGGDTTLIAPGLKERDIECIQTPGLLAQGMIKIFEDKIS